MTDREDSIPRVLAPLNGLLITLSFLTRIPVKALGFDKRSWEWSPAFFPLAGYILGALATVPFAVSQNYIIGKGIGFELCTPFLYLTILYWMNRMLHLDGFCDCCDGFSAMTDSREKRLEIMKDPCVGSSAAGAAIVLIFGKGLFLFVLAWQNKSIYTDYEQSLELIACLIAAPAFARFAIVALAYKASYPRKNGTGSVIVGNITNTTLIVAALSMLPLLFFIDSAVFKVSLAMSALSVIYWRRKGDQNLGGVTGDVLGACCETTELMVLLGFVLTT